MAIVSSYYCNDCGFELVDEGRLFYYDEKLGETVDFMLLMSTVGRDEGSKIRGVTSSSYCKTCDRYVRIYMIQEAEGITDPVETIRRGIEKHIPSFSDDADELRKIKKRENHTVEYDETEYFITFPEYDCFDYIESLKTPQDEAVKNALEQFHEEIDSEIDELERKAQRAKDAIVIILDETDRDMEDYGKPEKIQCPECGKMIDKHPEIRECPRCSSINMTCYAMMCD